VSRSNDTIVLQCDTGSISLDDLSRQITPEWLTGALSQRSPGVAVEQASIIKVFAGCSAKIWVRMRYNQVGVDSGLPDVMVVKAGFDRHDPIMLWTYQIEMQAYRDVLPRFAIHAPRCWYAGPSPDGASAAVIIEDLEPRGVRFCHALQPLSRDEAMRFMEAFAAFHAQSWQRPELTDGSWAWAIEQQETRAGLADYLGSLMSPDNWAKFVALPRGCAIPRILHDRDRFLRAFGSLQAFESSQPQVVLMGDEHLGNLYIESDGTPGFLDFQSRVAPWAQGIAYFLGNALDALDRRAWERDLIAHYLDRLASRGVTPPGFDEAWDAYCRSLLFGFFVWLTNGTQFQTESVCTANCARYAAAVIDNQTFERLGA
jgi:Ecdysteroid kinase-like family